MTSEQITEWRAYDVVDPIGAWREDFRSAQICSIVTNITRSIYRKEGVEPEYSVPIDFMPTWGQVKKEVIEEGPKQSVEEMKSIMVGLVRRTERLSKREQKI